MKKNWIIIAGASLLLIVLAVVYVTLRSSGSRCENVIPRNCKAIARIDFSNLHLDDAGATTYRDCGIDFTAQSYLFESADGSFGMVAKLKDDAALSSWLDKERNEGRAGEVTERKDVRFCVVRDNFLLGYTSSLALVMGPVMASDRGQLQRRMVKMLTGKDADVEESPLFRRLKEIDAPVAIVAEADALPDKFTSPLTLGVPKGTPLSKICLSARIEITDDVIVVNSETFSFDAKIDAALKSASSLFSKVSGRYTQYISSSDMLTMACGVKGSDLLNMLRGNEQLRAMLIGVNTAIDIDKMLRGVDGDVLLSIADMSGSVSLHADVTDTSWTQDVDYWKRSCPQGTTITDAGRQSWRFQGNGMDMEFGLTDNGKTLYVCSSRQAEAKPMDPKVKKIVEGKNLYVIINTDMMKWLSERIRTVVITK